MSLAFLLTSLVSVATPGTGASYTIAAGLSRGTRAGIIAAAAARWASCRTWLPRSPALPRCCAPAAWRSRW